MAQSTKIPISGRQFVEAIDAIILAALLSVPTLSLAATVTIDGGDQELTTNGMIQGTGTVINGDVAAYQWSMTASGMDVTAVVRKN